MAIIWSRINNWCWCWGSREAYNAGRNAGEELISDEEVSKHCMSAHIIRAKQLLVEQQRQIPIEWFPSKREHAPYAPPPATPCRPTNCE